MSHTYLDVPFKEKDEAKALGARWDIAARKWYVPAGKDLTLFHAWLSAGDKASAAPVTDLVTAPAAPPPALAPAKGISLSQLLAGVAQAVAQAFKSGVWTLVEVVEARTKNGHVYLELSERTPEGSVLATARASIWASTASKILPEFERATGATIAPGIKLLVSAKPVFKAQYGFSIEIDAIDPDYTLGDLEARKREIRTRLQQEGLFDANRKRPAPWDYQTLLVIAPQGAAGLGDFQAEARRLEQYGLCRFVYAHSRFQGEGAAQEIGEALRTALAQWSPPAAPDAVVIIRGGGAVNDLAWLNDYALARMLCTTPIPILTGIGHERDSTILDEVANVRFDTPSKVIAGIEQTIRHRAAEAQANFDQLVQGATRILHATRRRADQAVNGIQTGANRQVAMARQVSGELIGNLRLATAEALHTAQQSVEASLTQVRHTAHQHLATAQQDVPAHFATIRAEAFRAIGTARTQTEARFDGLIDRAGVDLRQVREDLALDLRDLGLAARRQLGDARGQSAALFREIAGQGPDKTLARGFALVRNPQGQPVTSATAAEPGAALEIEFRDGRVAAQVK